MSGDAISPELVKIFVALVPKMVTCYPVTRDINFHARQPSTFNHRTLKGTYHSCICYAI
jgi:hypothetical protein